jgi:hypothetical protein
MGVALVIIDIVVTLWMFLMYTTTYKRTQQLQEHIVILNQCVIDLHKTNKSMANAGSELVKVVDYLLIRDGVQGTYMGEGGDA